MENANRTDGEYFSLSSLWDMAESIRNQPLSNNLILPFESILSSLSETELDDTDNDFEDDDWNVDLFPHITEQFKNKEIQAKNMVQSDNVIEDLIN